MGNVQVLVLLQREMDLCIEVNGRTMNLMAKEYMNFLMEIITRVIGMLDKDMVKESMNGQTEKYIEEAGPIIK